MQLYYDSQASGGGANSDFGDLTNYWQDSSRTIPNGSLPGPTDDVELYDTVITCSFSFGLHDLTDSGSHSFSPANQQVTINGVATGIQFTGGNILSPIHASGCHFTADVGNIIGTNTCIYTANISSNITDDGTGNWGNHIGYVFSGTIISAGTIASEGCTFSGSVTAVGITIDQMNTSGSNFTGPVFVSSIDSPSAGPSYVTTFTNNLVTCSGVVNINQAQFVGTAQITFANVTTSITVGTIYGSVQPFYPFTIVFAQIPYTYTTIPNGVVNGVNTGVGTLTIPAQSDVRSGVVYGVGGNGSTGTLVSGSATIGFCG